MKKLLIFIIGIIQILAEEQIIGFKKEWNDAMQLFVPDDIIQFTVDSKEQEVLIQKIDQFANIRGTYFIPPSSKDTIDFEIIDPTGSKIFTKLFKKESFFNLSVTSEGNYQFIFKNKSKNPIAITFALDVTDADQDKIQPEDFDPLEDSVKNITSHIAEVYYASKLGTKRIESGQIFMQEANTKIMVLTFIETLIIVLVSVWQIWYVKKLFSSDRRLI